MSKLNQEDFYSENIEPVFTQEIINSLLNYDKYEHEYYDLYLKNIKKIAEYKEIKKKYYQKWKIKKQLK